MGKTLVTLLVGMHFRPPAKAVLECLPSGQALLLVPEPENPYDDGAIRVMLDCKALAETSLALLPDKLVGTGFDLEELQVMGEPLQMGYLAKSGGKPLEKAGLSVGNAEFAGPVSEGHTRATLGFLPSGLPSVTLEVPGDGQSE